MSRFTHSNLATQCPSTHILFALDSAANDTSSPHPLEHLTVQWLAALEAAETALQSATRYLAPQAVAAKVRRLAEERAEISQLLRALAHDLHTDAVHQNPSPAS